MELFNGRFIIALSTFCLFTFSFSIALSLFIHCTTQKKSTEHFVKIAIYILLFLLNFLCYYFVKNATSKRLKNYMSQKRDHSQITKNKTKYLMFSDCTAMQIIYTAIIFGLNISNKNLPETTRVLIKIFLLLPMLYIFLIHELILKCKTYKNDKLPKHQKGSVNTTALIIIMAIFHGLYTILEIRFVDHVKVSLKVLLNEAAVLLFILLFIVILAFIKKIDNKIQDLFLSAKCTHEISDENYISFFTNGMKVCLLMDFLQPEESGKETIYTQLGIPTAQRKYMFDEVKFCTFLILYDLLLELGEYAIYHLNVKQAGNKIDCSSSKEPHRILPYNKAHLVKEEDISEKEVLDLLQRIVEICTKITNGHPVSIKEINQVVNNNCVLVAPDIKIFFTNTDFRNKDRRYIRVLYSQLGSYLQKCYEWNPLSTSNRKFNKKARSTDVRFLLHLKSGLTISGILFIFLACCIHLAKYIHNMKLVACFAMNIIFSLLLILYFIKTVFLEEIASKLQEYSEYLTHKKVGGNNKIIYMKLKMEAAENQLSTLSNQMLKYKVDMPSPGNVREKMPLYVNTLIKTIHYNMTELVLTVNNLAIISVNTKCLETASHLPDVEARVLVQVKRLIKTSRNTVNECIRLLQQNKDPKDAGRNCPMEKRLLILLKYLDSHENFHEKNYFEVPEEVVSGKMEYENPELLATSQMLCEIRELQKLQSKTKEVL